MPDESPPRYPALLQVNTRVWLTDLGRGLGRPATLDDVPDADLDAFAESGFDWVWFLSVWSTGAEGRRISRTNAGFRQEFEATLPDLREEDIGGSGFAITAYTVAPELGGDAALARLRKRLRRRGLRLLLDFVPNHMALDHGWVTDHPDRFVAGSEIELLEQPQNYVWVKRAAGDLLLAHGRDPYFPGWPDTLQLDYANPATRDAMLGELLAISERCDGVRCDMAMLILPDVFERTWGRRPEPFWPTAIQRVRDAVPGFMFMAEVYWDLEWTMIQNGFDYAYDKRLYDRLREAHARPVREHLFAGLDYQDHLARFLENHDEPRAAATFPPGMYEAAAVITFLTPGLRFIHQGQAQGRRVRISPHLVRGPREPVNEHLMRFYEGLMAVLRRPVVRDGDWRLLDCVPAWAGDGSSDAFIAWSWQGADGERLLVAVNYSADPARCFVHLPARAELGGTVRLRDLLSDAVYDRDAGDLAARGLYLDIPGWAYHAFTVTAAA